MKDHLWTEMGVVTCPPYTTITWPKFHTEVSWWQLSYCISMKSDHLLIKTVRCGWKRRKRLGTFCQELNFTLNPGQYFTIYRCVFIVSKIHLSMEVKISILMIPITNKQTNDLSYTCVWVLKCYPKQWREWYWSLAVGSQALLVLSL